MSRPEYEPIRQPRAFDAIEYARQHLEQTGHRVPVLIDNPHAKADLLSDPRFFQAAEQIELPDGPDSERLAVCGVHVMGIPVVFA